MLATWLRRWRRHHLRRPGRRLPARRRRRRRHLRRRGAAAVLQRGAADRHRPAAHHRGTSSDWWDPFNPRAGIPGFFLDFDTYWTDPTTGQLLLIDGAPVRVNDGLDRIFGDYGDDWIVGGTYFDWLFGGWGEDILDLDDNHWTNGGLNDIPEEDEWFRQGDFAFGGADRDVLIGNSAMDRMFDWEGDENDFYVPFAFYGPPTVNRFYTAAIALFIRRLAYAGGTDVLLTPFEPFDEPAIVERGDPEYPSSFGPLGTRRATSRACRGTASSAPIPTASATCRPIPCDRSGPRTAVAPVLPGIVTHTASRSRPPGSTSHGSWPVRRPCSWSGS